jgi:peptidyl-prolyl cis-trans isomerase C
MVRRRFLMEVAIPEVLFALGAEAQKLDAQVRPAYDIERALSGATIRALRDRLGPASAIPMQDVQKYYDENRARYDTPERYQIWRILCKTREEAQGVLDQAKRDRTPKAFGELAREHSLDKATNLRDGNLGFVMPDGTSNEPGLRVDPAVVRAAQSVRDGEIVPAVVPEGEYFSVVWRRGTIPASHRTVDDVAASIRDGITKSRVKRETDKLLAELRAAKLRDLDESLLETVELPAASPRDR